MSRPDRRVLRGLGMALGPGILRGMASMARLRLIHAEREATAIKEHQGVIYAVWHGRMFLLISHMRYSRAGVLVSLSEDGELIARVMERLGYVPVRGSSSRRGSEGLRELQRHLEGGRPAAITPDGPRGPRHRAQLGAVILAARSGKPILPLSSASRNAWCLNSWDAFQIPKPGTEAAIVFGEPVLVPRTEDFEPWRVKLEEALNRVQAEADASVGRP